MARDARDAYIPAFYDGRSIFITGATGFLGKALIEKLLRSCPNIAEIYLLMRPKKGLDINERLKKMLNNKLYEKLQNEKPSSFDKLIPIIGDVSVEGLGLQPADRQTLIERVSIVVHVAANVRFDDSLKSAIFVNTRSTRDVCILAQEMKKLVSLVHVSSTYTQVDKAVVDEVLYPYKADWRQMIQIAESIDNHVLNIFTAKCLESFPNTYIFSKRLAEQVISDYSESLPCTIIRPSIVISSVEEPISGWLDNFNGPVGSYIGAGKGIMRVFYMDGSLTTDYIPVDMFVKNVIMITWIRGRKSIAEDNTVHVYNCAAHNVRSMSAREISNMGFDITKKIPLEGILWSPSLITTTNYIKFYVLAILLHVLPALLVDGVTKLLRMRPILLKLQRRIFITNNALSYFLLNTWQFNNTKLLTIFDNLSAANKEHFGFDYKNFDMNLYFTNALIGAKTILLKEDMSNLDAAKRHRKRVDWLVKLFRISFILVVLWILYRKNVLFSITDMFLSLLAIQ